VIVFIFGSSHKIYNEDTKKLTEGEDNVKSFIFFQFAQRQTVKAF